MIWIFVCVGIEYCFEDFEGGLRGNYWLLKHLKTIQLFRGEQNGADNITQLCVFFVGTHKG